MSRTTPLLAILAILALLAGACRDEEATRPREAGVTIDLLGRRPDALFEMPAAILPQGDVPGTLTFGDSEGPGWSQADQRLPGGVPYRETNQARAGILLPATRPADREIELALWCVRAAEAEPAPVSVVLNGIPLLPAPGLVPGREPALVRVHAPEAAWRLGANTLELAVPVRELQGRRAWDTLGLARVSYGKEARVALEPEGGLGLVDGTGAQYALELAEGAVVSLAGRVQGQGELIVRTGTLDPRSGAVTLDGDEPARFPSRAESLEGSLALTRRPGLVRILELEWYGPGGATLALESLRVRETTSPPRPPIVFVSIDTFAARHLALHGYARQTTPELAKLQGDAVLFERCLANAPWTLPSYLSVMSGLYPRAHWVPLDFQPGAAIQPFDQFSLAPNRWTLAEALRARGYRTGGFVDTQWLSAQTGVAQGFDTYNGTAALAPFSEVDKGIQLIVEGLVPEWLATTGADRPPFLFVHALDAHGPYLPEEPFRDVFFARLPETRTEVPTGSLNQTYRTIPSWMGRTLEPDESRPLPPTQVVEELVARYDETLLKVDAYLGKLFGQLRDHGLYDEAVIVVTGDHGEFFGPGMYGHGIMREDVLHVPLLVKLPGNAHAGRRVSTPVALVDVYPTLLALAGIPADASRLHGESLLEHLETPREDAERPLFTEGGHVEQYALTLGRWRLVEEWPGRESADYSLLTHPRVPEAWLEAHAPELRSRPLTGELLEELMARPGFRAALAELRVLVNGPYFSLFDAETDPGDLRDLAAEHPEWVERLKPLLEAEKERSRRARSEARAVVTRPLPAAALEELRKLGYGGGEAGTEEAGPVAEEPADR